jgi:hypothetical protein
VDGWVLLLLTDLQIKGILMGLMIDLHYYNGLKQTKEEYSVSTHRRQRGIVCCEKLPAERTANRPYTMNINVLQAAKANGLVIATT